MAQNFFGARHGKSSCDACMSQIKQGVSRLVHSGTEVVNSAGTLFTTCLKHLQKTLTKQSEECQHHILTFHLHKTLKSRPHTISWPGVPNTCKFRSIGNTNTKDVYLRNFTCCCVGCLHGDEPCSNDVCPDEWQGYSFKRDKFMEPNLDFWFHDREPDLHILHVENVDWATHINEMSSIQLFTDLQVYVNNNPLLEFVCEPKYTMSAAEMENLDLVALHHVPNDAPRNVSPIQIEGDGNCFPRSISYICTKAKTITWKKLRTKF